MNDTAVYTYTHAYKAYRYVGIHIQWYELYTHLCRQGRMQTLESTYIVFIYKYTAYIYIYIYIYISQVTVCQLMQVLIETYLGAFNPGESIGGAFSFFYLVLVGWE